MQLATASSVHEDRLVVAGTFNRELAFGEQLITGDDSVDAFIASFDSDSTQWLRTIQGPGEEVVQDVVTWDDGLVAVGLVSDGAVLLDSVATVDGGTRPLLAELSTAGELRGLARFEGAGYSAFTKIARSAEGLLYVGGEVAGRLELGETTVEGGGQGFVAQLDNEGSPSWVLQLSPHPDADSDSDSNAGTVKVSDVKLGPDGSIYVTGLFAGGLSVGSEVLAGNHALAQTPYLLHVAKDGELLFASIAMADVLVHQGHENHAGSSHSEHSAFVLNPPSVMPLDDGHALMSVAFGIPFSGHGGDFEAPAMSNLSFLEMDDQGEVARVDTLRGEGIIAGKVSLVTGKKTAAQALTSWVGTLHIDNATFVSEQGRSTLLLDWSPEQGISNPRSFQISGLSVTSDSACTSGRGIWSAGHQVDSESGERDAIILRFANAP
jgi:hypothetical protein